MTDNTTFDLNGHKLTIKFFGTECMINATEMAKPFDKDVKDFLYLPSTKAFIALMITRDLERSENQSKELEIIRTYEHIANGKRVLTAWLDIKLGLKFAAWLSPELELWMFDRIGELMGEQ